MPRGAPATRRHRLLTRLREHAQYLDGRISQADGVPLHAAEEQRDACTWAVALVLELRDRGLMAEIDQAAQDRIADHEAGRVALW